MRSRPRLERWQRLALLRYRAHTAAYPDWKRLLGKDIRAWEQALRAARDGPRVLLATHVGGYTAGANLESLLAVALTLRGARVETLLCDAALPACLLAHNGFYPDPGRFARLGPQADLCGSCHPPAAAMYRSLGLPVLTLSTLIEDTERTLARELAEQTLAEKIPDFHMGDIPVGEHALAGALRFHARADLVGVAGGEAVLRRYLEAALLTAYAMRRALRNARYRVALLHHGIYVPQGIAAAACREHGVRVATWNPAYRKQCFIFSHEDTYHHTLMTEPVDEWENLPWDDAKEKRLLAYLRSRWEGTEDWIWFHERPRFDVPSIERELGVDFSRPCIGLLTNVSWDAQIHYPANAFRSMHEWLVGTIQYFSRRPDLQLLIRIHPAEIRGTLPSRQRVDVEIAQAFPSLPANVKVVPPESRISTYAALARCNAALIFGTKMGVELTSMGIPTIVAGEAWIRNKGITLDASTADDYFRILDRLPLPGPLDDAAVLRARKYAYHFFFRRMIPLPWTRPAGGDPPFRLALDGLAALAPGNSRGLDVICDGLLEGRPFVYPAEEAEPHDGEPGSPARAAVSPPAS